MNEGAEEVASGGHRKVIVITQWWAGVFGSVFAAALIGGCAYAFDTNASFAVLQGQVAEIREAQLPTRITTLEAEVKTTREQVVAMRVESSRGQERMDDKLDRLLRR